MSNQTNDSPIVIEGLRKAFGEQKVLDGINLKVAKGETVAVIGRSGGGKSVFLKLLIRLQTPDSGSIRIAGQEITKLNDKQFNDVRKKIGFLISTTSQRIISRLQERNNTRIPQREKTHLSGMSVGPQASFDVVMLPCPLFCLLQFLESGVDVFDRLYSVPAPLRSSVLKLAFCGM